MRILTVGKIKRFRYVASTMYPGWTGVLWRALVDDFRSLPLGQIVAGFHTLESSRCSDSNEEHRAAVVDCTQVSFGNAAAGKRVPVLT